MQRFYKVIAVIAFLSVPFCGVCHADDPPSTLKPEMVIRFTQGTLACLSKDDLQEATEHAIKGERTKVEAMMLQNGGSCIMVSPTKRVKILSVEYNNPDMPDLGLVEVVGEGIISGNGAWAFTLGAEPVISKHKMN